MKQVIMKGFKAKGKWITITQIGFGLRVTEGDTAVIWLRFQTYEALQHWYRLRMEYLGY